jgi:hypothetical protein
MESITSKAKSFGSALWNHKFKFLFSLIVLYGAKKCYDLYKFIKPFLELKNQLTGGGASSSTSAKQGSQQQAREVELSESQKTLEQLLSQ